MAPRFYFGTISPYSWFAAERVGGLLPEPEWRPVFAGGLFRSVGRTSWGMTEQRAERVSDCQRRAAQHGLGTVQWPDGWPGNDVLPAPSFANLRPAKLAELVEFLHALR